MDRPSSGAVLGSFAWVSRAASNYVNWALGEPNNTYHDGGPEFYVHLWDGTWPDAIRTPESWNDLPDRASIDGIPLCGVVELPPFVAPGTPVTATIFRAVEVAWPTEIGRLYQVQWASELIRTNWFNFGGAFFGDGATNSVLDETRTAGKRFYRVLRSD
jgi:hypothetical protein